ncbi:MAG TPA: SIMPL domain-containing protein [Chthoniobacterales bacterium]|nr:SIMPL domain-containing protein [Chthoniobacterales bacterium]HMG12536.1 SIMPL domain-containing protein [Gemmatimonadaceae bacterium]
MKKLVLLACVSLPLSLLAGGGLPDKPYIYVEGKAEIEKPADMVTLRFDLVARNPDQAKANQEVQAKANKILAMMKERRIADNDVIAGDIKSAPQYSTKEESGYKQGKIIGYSVTRIFSVGVRDVTAFARLVDELLAIGGTEFSGIEGGLTKEKEARDEIFEKALANAREQAEKTLKTMGMKIDAVFAVSPVPMPEIQARMFPNSSTERVIVTGSYIPNGGNLAPAEYRIAPVTISQSIHVIYLISPAK